MSSVVVWLAGPLDGVEVQPVPWYLYVGMAIILMFAGAVARLLFVPYRNVQTGKMIPEPTVQLMIAAKDAEIAHLQEEVARWVGNYHIKDAAYVSLAEIIDENTDALRALAAIPPAQAIRSTRDSEAPNARNRRERA